MSTYVMQTASNSTLRIKPGLMGLIVATHFTYWGLVTCGCGHTPRGVFVESEKRTRSLQGVPGHLQMIHAYRYRISADKPAIRIYWLVVLPYSTPNGSGSEFISGRTKSIYRSSWTLENDEFITELHWNRDSDLVTAGDKTFDRKRGNVFVTIKEQKGLFSTTQLANLPSHLAGEEAMERIRATYPDQDLARRLRLQDPINAESALAIGISQ